MSSDLTAEEMAAWRPFITAATVVVGAMDAEMKADFDISHLDHALLMLLLEQPRRRARMIDVARSLRVDPSGVTYRVRRLERLRLVDRVADPDDRRVSYARLTPRGMRLLREAWPRHRDAIRRHFLQHVRPDQLPVIAEVFGSIVAAQHPSPALPDAAEA